MITVNKRQVDLIDGKLVGEASEMGLGAGEWPDFIAVVDDANEGFLFQRGEPDISNGEIAGVRYFGRTSGVQLLVIND